MITPEQKLQQIVDGINRIIGKDTRLVAEVLEYRVDIPEGHQFLADDCSVGCYSEVTEGIRKYSLGALGMLQVLLDEYGKTNRCPNRPVLVAHYATESPDSFTHFSLQWVEKKKPPVELLIHEDL